MSPNVDQAPDDCENMKKGIMMYENNWRVWEDKNDDTETFLNQNNEAYNCYVLINKPMRTIVKALRVINDYISDQERKGKKILLISLFASHG